MSIELLNKSKDKWTVEDAAFVKLMQENLNILRTGTPGAQEKAMNIMCKKIGAKLLAPSRCSQLAEGEEAVRAELTWQQIDERIFLAALGGFEELRDWVADSKSFLEDREKTWLAFSDQVPIWINIGMLTVLYSALALAEKGHAVQAAVRAARRKMNASRGKDSQNMRQQRQSKLKLKKHWERKRRMTETCHQISRAIQKMMRKVRKGEVRENARNA